MNVSATMLECDCSRCRLDGLWCSLAQTLAQKRIVPPNRLLSSKPIRHNRSTISEKRASDTVSGRLTRTGFLRRREAVIFDSHESREASHGACSGSSEHRGIGGALPEVCGCVRGAALPDDLASGTGPYGGGSFRTDEFCAALDRGTSGPL